MDTRWYTVRLMVRPPWLGDTKPPRPQPHHVDVYSSRGRAGMIAMRQAGAALGRGYLPISARVVA